MGFCESNPRLAQKKIYFQKIYSTKTDTRNNFQNYKTQVKLDFSLQNAKIGENYKIYITFIDNKNNFSTEEIKSSNATIIFNTFYICDYYFEKQQYFNISLMKNRKPIGYKKIALGIVVGSPKSTYSTEIDNCQESVIIKANPLNDTSSSMIIDFNAKNLDKYFGEIKNKISFRILGQSGNCIYDSESVNIGGIFDTVEIPLALLEPSFTVSFLDSFGKNLIYKQETPDSFVNIPPNSLYLGIINNDSRINIYNNSKINRQFTFIDYIKNGVTIKLTIGIDFTSSNNAPDNPESLHYLGGGMNDYELAIKACGTIVAYYDYNQSFPVYGFGAVIKGQNKANMCFNINFKQNPEIYTIDNVLKEYRKCFNNIILAGPTEFCPLVKRVNETIKKENNPLKYHILMILTDGVIVDLQETIDALVEGSFLPLSVIIIGIGNDHFKEMIQLDGDKIPIISSNGIKRMRDLVQFVPFNRYRNDPNELAAQVLEEVPRQIMEYYTMNNIYPYNLAKAQLNKFGLNNNNVNNFNNINTMNNNNFNGQSYYEQNGNSYNDYKKYNNDTYKNYMNSSKFTGASNMNKNMNSGYHVVFEDEKKSFGTGSGSIFY